MYKVYLSEKLNTDALLKFVLQKYNIDDEICFNEYGKPYLKNSDLYFNLSNSGSYSVCAISNKEIGIDIEKITYKERVISRILAKNEKNIIKNKYDFTKLWVKKEAYVKCLGIGLSYGLKNVDTTKLNIDIIRYKDTYIGLFEKI